MCKLTFVCNRIRAQSGGAHVYGKCNARTRIKMNNTTILDTADNTVATSHSKLDLLVFFLCFSQSCQLYFFFHRSVKFASGAAASWALSGRGSLLSLLYGNRKCTPSFYIWKWSAEPEKGLVDDAQSQTRRISAQNDSYCLRATSAVKSTINSRSNRFNSIISIRHGLSDRGQCGITIRAWRVTLSWLNECNPNGHLGYFFSAQCGLPGVDWSGELQLTCTNYLKWLTQSRASWCSRHDLRWPCSRSPSPACRGSFRNCARARGPGWLQLPEGCLNGPATNGQKCHVHVELACR